MAGLRVDFTDSEYGGVVAFDEVGTVLLELTSDGFCRVKVTPAP